MVCIKRRQQTVSRGAIANNQVTPHRPAVERNGIETGAIVELGSAHKFQIERKRPFQAEMLAPRTFLIQRPGLLQRQRRIVRAEPISRFGPASNLTTGLTMEPGQRVFFIVILLDDVVLRKDRVIEHVRKSIHVEGLTRSGELGEDLRVRMSEAEEHESVRMRPAVESPEYRTRQACGRSSRRRAAEYQADLGRANSNTQNTDERQRIAPRAAYKVAWRDPQAAVRLVPERILINGGVGAAEEVIPGGQVVAVEFGPAVANRRTGRPYLDIRNRGSQTHLGD